MHPYQQAVCVLRSETQHILPVAVPESVFLELVKKMGYSFLPNVPKKRTQNRGLVKKKKKIPLYVD